MSDTEGVHNTPWKEKTNQKRVHAMPVRGDVQQLMKVLALNRSPQPKKPRQGWHPCVEGLTITKCTAVGVLRAQDGSVKTLSVVSFSSRNAQRPKRTNQTNSSTCQVNEDAVAADSNTSVASPITALPKFYECGFLLLACFTCRQDVAWP